VGPLDSAVYLEYVSEPTFKEHGIEAKLILAKTVAGVEAALNAEYVATISAEGVEHELEPTLGVAWHVKPWFSFGAESRVELETEDGVLEGPRAWAGPVVHVAGEGGRFWVTLSGLAPLTADTAADHGVILRSLVAVNI
jgi:hypothetical protein